MRRLERQVPTEQIADGKVVAAFDARSSADAAPESHRYGELLDAPSSSSTLDARRLSGTRDRVGRPDALDDDESAPHVVGDDLASGPPDRR